MSRECIQHHFFPKSSSFVVSLWQPRAPHRTSKLWDPSSRFDRFSCVFYRLRLCLRGLLSSRWMIGCGNPM